MRSFVSLVSTTAAVLLMTVVSGELFAEQIDGCYNRRRGTLRIRTEAVPNCQPSEEPISWNSYEITPPIIDRTLTCIDPFTLTLGLSIADDVEVAFFAIQKQGTDPALNYVYSVEPGIQLVEYEITLGVGPGEESYLVLASNMEGHVAKNLFTIPPDFCSSP